ncbi:MAG TPA: type II secretion system protein [Candidatus Eremiobacteraceae bacterium]|jgi:prepilin-type N-terminal cleavage/methylation domain-containing protein
MRSIHPVKGSRGFSLVELLVVVAIIAILAMILFVLFAHERDNANVASCEQNERSIAFALDSYSIDHFGQYPNYQGDVTVAMFGGPGNPYFTTGSLVDPASGLPYQYTSGPGSCQDPNTEYQIVDQGGHSSISLLALLANDDAEDSIAFCSTRGLYAMQSGNQGGGTDQKHGPTRTSP